MSLESLFASLDPEELDEIVSNPIPWAEALLKLPTTGQPFRANFTQQKILGADHRYVVIRVHRRAGKSVSLSILALFYCFVLEGAEILIVCPQQQQVSELFTKIREFIRANEWMTSYIANNGRSPQRIEFTNGSRIVGYTTGARQKSKALGLRGAGADVVLIDEAAFLNEEDWEAIKPIMAGDQHRRFKPKVYISSTPGYTRGAYYDYCTKDELAGICHRIHVRLPDNPEWPEDEKIARRAESNDLEWCREWLAEFPELGEGVFPKWMVDRARKGYSYEQSKKSADEQRRSPATIPQRTMGVDWDKYNRDGHGSNIVVLELMNTGRYRVVYREEIPQSEFTLDMAVNRVIELNELFEPMWIYVDRGYGDFQIEQLHLHGRKFRHTKLDERVVGVQFAEKVEMPTPNGTIVPKRFKEASVSLLRKWLEDDKLEFSIFDKDLLNQFIGYQVIGQTEHTLKFSSDNDHAIAAAGLAAMAMLLRVKNPYRPETPQRSYVLPAPVAIPSRVIRRERRLDRGTILATESDFAAGSGSFNRSYLGDRPPSPRKMF